MSEDPKKPRDSTQGLPDAPVNVPAAPGTGNPGDQRPTPSTTPGGSTGQGQGKHEENKDLPPEDPSTATGATTGGADAPTEAGESTDLDPDAEDEGMGGDPAESDGTVDVELPEFEVHQLEADDRLLERGEDLAGLEAHPLAGIWVQVEGDNAPDFGPGGFERSIVMLNPAANIAAVYRAFRGSVAIVMGAEFALDAPMDPDDPAQGTAAIRTDPSLSGKFPGAAIELGPDASGREIFALPPDGAGPWNLAWSREGPFLVVDGRRYAPIGREEFENIRRGGADIPTAQDLAVRIANGRGPGGGEPPNETSFFGIKGGGKRVCFICDISGSMEEAGKLDRLKQELEKTLKRFRGDARFLVIFFDGQAHVMHQTWMKGVRDRRRAIDLVRAQGTGGGTDPRESFTFAFGTLSPLPDLIYFMTDGMIPPETPAHVKSLNVGKNRTVIHAINFGLPSAEPIMRQIASENGGQYLFVKP